MSSSRSRGQADVQKSKRNYALYAKVCVGVLLVGTLVYGLKSLLSNPAVIQSFLDGAKDHPGKTIPLFVLANLFAPLFLLPNAPFQLLAGAVWGVGLGMAISGTTSLVANLAAFAFGRYFFRESLQAYMTSNVPSFPSIQAAIVNEGWRLVVMLRLSPVLPDSLMNYALSLMPITFNSFASASAVAMVPWGLLYVYLGSASKDIVATMTGAGGGGGDDGGGSSWVNITLSVVSIVLVVVAVVYLGRVVKAAIAKAEAGRKDAVHTKDGGEGGDGPAEGSAATGDKAAVAGGGKSPAGRLRAGRK